MSTTALAVELLIIGYQTLFWVVLSICLFPVCDETMLAELKDWNELLIIGSIVAAYTSGAIMNGIVAGLMEWLGIDKKWIYKTNSPKPSEMRAAILARNPDAFVQVIKNFDVPRVLRSTTPNIILIGVFTSIHLIRNSVPIWPQLSIVIFLFIIGAVLTAWAWYETAENFYIHLSRTFQVVTKKENVEKET